VLPAFSPCPLDANHLRERRQKRAATISRRREREFARVTLQGRPRSADRTQSPVAVSQKREYFNYPRETISDFSLEAAKWGPGDRPPIRKSPPLAGISGTPGGNISMRRTGWLRQQDSNLDMASLKSDALACPRGTSERHFIRIHKPLETFEFRKPYRIGRVQSSGEKWTNRRRMSRLCRLKVWSFQMKRAAVIGLLCQQTRAENTRLRPGWRRERNWGRTFSA
jgi:hypothetical protein